MLHLTSGPCLGPSDLLFRFLDHTHSPAFTSKGLRTHSWPQVPPFRRGRERPVLFWTVALQPHSHLHPLHEPTMSSLRRYLYVYVTFRMISCLASTFCKVLSV